MALTEEQFKQLQQNILSRSGKKAILSPKTNDKDKTTDTIKKNRKIVGVKKIVIGDVKFDSLLESEFYLALQSAKIPFDFKKTICLVPSFLFHNHSIRPITWSPDFYIEKLNIIIDTKGYFNDIAPLKIKMCKWWLLTNDMEDWQIWIIKKKSEIPNAINQLLYSPKINNFEV